jgi:hypothetical protein
MSAVENTVFLLPNIPKPTAKHVLLTQNQCFIQRLLKISQLNFRFLIAGVNRN